MEKIDNLDKKILQIVMRNARIPSKDVAVVCGVSRAAIHQRIQRMIDLKVITGSGYHVNPKVLGYATCTYISVARCCWNFPYISQGFYLHKGGNYFCHLQINR